MGTYTELIIANYPVISSKSVVIPEAMTVFRETDRHVFTRRVGERNALVWGEGDSNDDESETAIEYSCEIKNVIDRLNVMGFTLRRVQEDFETGQIAELNKYSSWAENDSDTQSFGDDWALIKGLTFNAYTDAFAKVISEGMRPYPFDDHKKEGIGPVVKYILKNDDEYLFGFLGSDIRSLLRLVCEVVPENSRIVYDITALVHSGYYEEQEPVCENAIRFLVAGHPENSPQIILTEGSTDARILQDSLALLYPHLSAYYTFFDFKYSRAPGGAGYLVSLVKAFSATGISNRIVALFDNDTAAHEARLALKTISLPPNIAVRAYPELELLRTYPTLGPGGLTLLNVNGLAASIELYLGEDVLRTGQGKLTPVQWTGYCQALKRHQGEVRNKAKLQTTFYDKVKRCMADPESLKITDWSGISAILQDIFRAFE